MNFFEKIKQLKDFDRVITQKKQEVLLLDTDISKKKETIAILQKGTEEAASKKKSTQEERDKEIENTKIACENIIKGYEFQTNEAREKYEKVCEELRDTAKELSDTINDVHKNKEKIKLYKSFIKKTIKSISNDDEIIDTNIDELCPTVKLHFNSFDVKDLKILQKENQKLIDAVLAKYEVRYTTKSNKAIYQLMVLALRAELQNILIDLKYSNIDKCKENLNKIISKFMSVASDGNQSIAPTIKAFIGEIGVLFENTIDIEYTYFVRKEQEKAEQQALREQMRQEAEERKALEQEQKKVEKEESKYKTEISNTEELLENCKDSEKTKQLLARIEELKSLLKKVEEKKEDIINRQNGKAGNVYIISNLGSFGNNRFKIGMTRRIEPMDRVRELGDASVPFSFDVHSFIFSDDAVKLEKNCMTD